MNTNIQTNGDRIGITNAPEPLDPIEALVHVVNEDVVGVGLLVTSRWQGETGADYINNDNSLFTTYNKILSDSANRSWGASINNAYNDIPEGVTDGGERVGAIGWATSVHYVHPKWGEFKHSGTLAAQTGLLGTAGFQNTGSGPNAVVVDAHGVRGLIYANSPGATIKNAFGGKFASDGGTSTVERSYGVYSRGKNGTIANYSFYGEAGKLFNADQVALGTEFCETAASLTAHEAGNSVEFGYPGPAGYGSCFGASYSAGTPFVAFCAEADPAGNTFRTRGKKGAMVWSDLTGALIFSRLTNANASGQTPVESARITPDGHLKMALPTYADNAAAIAGGLTATTFYKTATGEVRIVV